MRIVLIKFWDPCAGNDSLKEMLKRLEASKSIAKWKENDKYEKKIISLNTSTSMFKVEDDEDNLNDYSLKDEEMLVFVRQYNKYMKKKV